jgi:predicted nucleic acid-binding protein
MIHLDANVLIRLSVPGSGAANKVRQWLLAGETLAVSAPAWFEYMSGPLTAQEVLHAEAILTGGVVDFQKADSHRAADLFNLTERKRSTKLDCMIAASAMLHRARVATTNVVDFQPFSAHGLSIEAVPV